MLTANGLSALAQAGEKANVLLASVVDAGEQRNDNAQAFIRLMVEAFTSNVPACENKLSWQVACQSFKATIDESLHKAAGTYLSKLRKVNKAGTMEVRDENGNGEIVGDVNVWEAWKDGDYSVSFTTAYNSASYKSDKAVKAFESATRKLISLGMTRDEIVAIVEAQLVEVEA